MKKSLQITAIMLISILFTNCGGSGSKIKTNEFLGKIPSLEKNYYNKVEAKEKDLKECTDFEKSFKLSKEVDLLKEEWKEKIKEEYKNNPLNKSLPFVIDFEPNFTINDIKIKEGNKGGMPISFTVTLNEDLKNEYGMYEKFFFIYFSAIDKSGNELEGSKTVAASSFGAGEMKAGLQFEVNGSWQTKAIINLEEFAKVRVMAKAEYEKN